MNKTPMTVLLVDGTAENLCAMQALLQGDDLQVLTAADGPQALDVLQRHAVDLVLLDLQLPDTDARALAERLRAGPGPQPLPIVFITTAGPDALPRFRGDESGVVDVVYKPVDARVLRSKLQLFLDLHRQRTQLAQRMAELERLARLNALMIGALSHDIRSPLAALTLNAELVSRRHALPAMQQAGARLKAATLMLSRQVDHLVNLASLPPLGETPQPARGDLAALVAARLQLLQPAADAGLPASLELQGDNMVAFDPAMVARAVDHLLLLALTHGGGQPLRVEVNGESRRAVTLRLSLPGPLDPEVHQHLLGAALPELGLPPARLGPGLDAAERVARAHGGSVIGRSSAREGTLFELMLPRDLV